jgi:hypothetical protein
VSWGVDSYTSPCPPPSQEGEVYIKRFNENRLKTMRTFLALFYTILGWPLVMLFSLIMIIVNSVKHGRKKWIIRNRIYIILLILAPLLALAIEPWLRVQL